MSGGRPRYPVTVCIDAPRQCPSHPDFEHDNCFGCVPKDFSPRTGKSKKYRQHPVKNPDVPGGVRWHWNGGCNPAPVGDGSTNQ